MVCRSVYENQSTSQGYLKPYRVLKNSKAGLTPGGTTMGFCSRGKRQVSKPKKKWEYVARNTGWEGVDTWKSTKRQHED